jgi:tRNA nucleotidyltransferase (CCA-adding enzyme)
LQAPYWAPALQLLAALGALKCLHPSLELDQPLWWQVQWVDRGLRRFDPQKTLTHWQMRLEVLIAALEPDDRELVAKNLQLPVESIERLKQLADAEATVVEALATRVRPSAIARLLRQYDLPTLILIAVKTQRQVRRQIWQYLTQWSHVQPPLNGNDLKALGYQPGRQYREILDTLWAATLDGEISIHQTSPEAARTQAKAFLAEHYPR